MSDFGGLPRLPAICSQCGESFAARACGPTHAIVWQSIEAPVTAARREALEEAARAVEWMAVSDDGKGGTASSGDGSFTRKWTHLQVPEVAKMLRALAAGSPDPGLGPCESIVFPAALFPAPEPR
jgi:hypothetical protein